MPKSSAPQQSRIMKSGRVVILTNGRFAGRKAVIVKHYDAGVKSDAKNIPFGCALVAGVDRYPRKITKSMGKKTVAKRSKVKPFLKFVNYNHVMPTRYTSDIDIKRIVNDTAMHQADSRKEMRKEIKKVMEQRYLNQNETKSEKSKAGTAFLFKKLAF